MKHFAPFRLVLLALITFGVMGCAGYAKFTGYTKPGTKINLSAPSVVLSDNTGMLQDMTFLDIFSTELLTRGVNLIDRSTLQGMLKDKGVNWGDVISGQQYFKIGENSPVQNIIIVNATMVGELVARASCRVVDAKTGALLLSMNVTNPAPYNGMYIGNSSTSTIVKRWANQVQGKKSEDDE